MIFKLVSKDIQDLVDEIYYTRTSFHVDDGFLFFRGIKIAICNYPTLFTNKKLFIDKEGVVETYELTTDTGFCNYDVHDGLLRVFDSENTLLKIFAFEEIIEINDGTILKGSRTVFLDLEGNEVEIKVDFNDENVLICPSDPSTVWCKKCIESKSIVPIIDLTHNIIVPDIIVDDDLYAIAHEKEVTPVDLFSPLPQDDYFLCKFGESVLSYNVAGKLLLFLNGIFLCQGTVPIKNIILMSSFHLENKKIYVIVTGNRAFMIYNDLISYFEHDEIIYNIEQNINNVPYLNGLNKRLDLDGLYLTLSLFEDLPILLKGLESFLFDLFIYTKLGDEFIGKIYRNNGWSSEFETILCNLYRFVDDKNKKSIDKILLKEKIREITNIKKIIIYHHNLIPYFIERCINEHKEFEIEGLIEHFRDSVILKEISMELLRYNCFYLFTLCYPQYVNCFDDNLLKIEKYNLMSQRKRNECEQLKDVQK